MIEDAIKTGNHTTWMLYETNVQMKLNNNHFVVFSKRCFIPITSIRQCKDTDVLLNNVVLVLFCFVVCLNEYSQIGHLKGDPLNDLNDYAMMIDDTVNKWYIHTMP